MPRTQTEGINPSLIALKPRQIVLQLKKQQLTMKKGKASPSAHGTLGNGSKTLNPQQKALLLESIFFYLQRLGFSKTLKRFRSEANLENVVFESCSLDLEEMCYKYLESCNHLDKTSKSHKERDLQLEVTTKNNGDNVCDASVKNKKRNEDADNAAAVYQVGATEKASKTKDSKEITTNNLSSELQVKSKEKKKCKNVSDSLGHASEPVKESVDEHVGDLELDESSKKSREKKKMKNKLVSQSLDENLEHPQLNSLQGVSKKISKDLVSLEGKSEANISTKEKKRKKHKSTSDSLGDSVIQSSFEETNEAVATTFNDGSQKNSITKTNNSDILFEENGKSKSRKRKDKSLVSGGGDGEQLDKERSTRIDCKEDDFLNSEDAINKEQTSLKKRKRLASEASDAQPFERVVLEESKRRKTEFLEESKFQESAGYSVEELKGENDKSLKKADNQLDAHGNGILEKSGGKSASQKTMRNQSDGSVGQKTVNAFQRVKVDEVVFADEKLQDNSYWAKDGAEIGYGAKAQEVLGQVRGRDFRHEKTKKKRGSYRGGLIDLQSHSIKFNYSDED